MSDNQPRKRVLVCQNRTCRKDGSNRVLAAFEVNSVSGVEVVGCGCLGQCGNGPMVLVEPDRVWYSQVRPSEVRVVVERHLQKDCPVKAMLYRKFHRAV